MLSIIKKTTKKMPYLRRFFSAGAPVESNPPPVESNPPSAKPCWVPPGHYYSPIPDVAELDRRQNMIWGSEPRSLPGIDLHTDSQFSLVCDLERYYRDQPFERTKQTHLRYWFENAWFGSGDAILLHCLMRHLRPARILEVGSGFSSAAILDTNDLFFHGRLNCTFIEPEPQRLLSLLTPAGQKRHRIIAAPLQDVELEPFRELQAKDILFIDTSHVVKTGGEVNRILFEILPALSRGVYIHIHDIFYPFEYSKEWVFEGRSWNEIYALRAFLQYNTTFAIRLFNSYLVHRFTDWFRSHMPLCVECMGGGIWLEKMGD